MLAARYSSSIDPSCPSGGTWYACPRGAGFLGCCASNPCNNNGCPDGNLKPASFNGSDYGNFPDQECTAGQFYTCANTKPPFLGCCQSENPCDMGSCSQTNLAAAFLSKDADLAAPFLSESAGATSSATSPSTSSITSSTTISAPTASVTSAGQQNSFPESASIGVAIAASAFVVGLLILLTCLFVRRSRRRRMQSAIATVNDVPLSADTNKYTDSTSSSPKKNEDESTNIDSSPLPKWMPHRPTTFPCNANMYADLSELWMDPVSLGLLHGEKTDDDIPQLDSMEISELDSVCIGKVPTTSEQAPQPGEGIMEPPTVSSLGTTASVGGKTLRSSYIPYRPGVNLRKVGE